MQTKPAKGSGGHPYNMPPTTSNCGGFDTLAISIMGRLSTVYKESTWQQIHRAQDCARKGDEEHACIELPGGRRAIVARHGIGKGAGHLPFKVDCEGVVIGLAGPMTGEGTRVAAVELGSEILMEKGHNEAWELARLILEDLGIIEESNVVSRADICVDLPGVKHEELTDLFTRRWRVTRARDWGVYGKGLKGTGFHIGKSNAMLRVYDKREESKRYEGTSKFVTLRDRRWGGVVPPNATRVEFEMKRDLLRRHDIDSIEQLFDLVSDVALWLTSDWFRLTATDPDASNCNQSKVEDAKIWEDVKRRFEAWTGQLTYRLQRRKTPTPDPEALCAQMVGVAETIAACSPEYVREPNELIAIVTKAIARVWKAREKGDGIRERIALKREKLRALGRWDHKEGLLNDRDPYPEFMDERETAIINKVMDVAELEQHAAELDAWQSHPADCWCDTCTGDGI